MKAGWKSKTLAEVCQIKPPKTEARLRIAGTDLVSFVPMEDLGIDQKFMVPTQAKPLSDVVGSYTYFAEGDVLLAKITPCFENGKLGIAAKLTNSIGFGSSEYIVFRPGPSIGKDWLYYFLSRESFRTEGAESMSGAVGHKRVAKSFIEAYLIPVPPISEQQRIVAILDGVGVVYWHTFRSDILYGYIPDFGQALPLFSPFVMQQAQFALPEQIAACPSR
jgi:type I restriction enzyme S subunit